MPLIQSAIKKMRKDKARTARNKKREDYLKNLIKKARVQKNPTNLSAVFSALDKAAKVHLIHPNKAARLKSRLSKSMGQRVIKLSSKSSKKKVFRKTNK